MGWNVEGHQQRVLEKSWRFKAVIAELYTDPSLYEKKNVVVGEGECYFKTPRLSS
jgi:hypothetical protein